MEIARVQEPAQPQISEEVRLRKCGGNACIYYAETVCVLPRLKFGICRSCPRAAQFVRKNVVRSVFQYIRNLAISFLKGMDLQPPR